MELFMDETVQERRLLPHWRRILLWFVVAAMVLLAGVMLASYVVGKQLGSEIVKISEVGEPLTFPDVAEAQVRQDTDGEDASSYYLEALTGIGPASLPNLKRIHSFYRQNMVALPANQFPSDLRESVSQNLVAVEAMFEKLDKGASGPLARFDIGIRKGVQAAGTHIQRAHTVVLLLSLRTMDLILQGKDDAAVDSVVSLLKLMRIFDSHPTLLVHTIKAQFVGLACEDVRLLLERGSASAESLAKLEKALLETVGADALERVFLAERVYQTELGRNLIPQNVASLYLQEQAPDIPERIRLPGSFLGRLRLRQKARRYFRGIDRIITASRRSWPEPLDEIKVPEATKKPDKLASSSGLLTRMTAEVFVAVRCTRLAVAIERYRRRHGDGELPAALGDLAPTYIDTIPLDPYTGQQLLYSYDEESFTIYGTGANRADDGGSIRPKEGEKTPLDRGLRIRFGGVK
jgi:hypothetical protein